LGLRVKPVKRGASMRANALPSPRSDAGRYVFGLQMALACCICLLMLVYLLPTGHGGKIETRWKPLEKVQFSLVDHTGAAFGPSGFVGHPTALFFGFASCPEVCPTTLTRLTALEQKVGPAAKRLKVVFVSVDPARDTQSMLATYLSNFALPVTGLTGAVSEIDKLVSALGAVYVKTPTEGGGYTIDHTALVYLLDEQGALSSTIAYDEASESALAKLKMLLEAGK
jgi:protein SCO1/2